MLVLKIIVMVLKAEQQYDCNVSACGELKESWIGHITVLPGSF